MVAPLDASAADGSGSPAERPAPADPATPASRPAPRRLPARIHLDSKPDLTIRTKLHPSDR